MQLKKTVSERCASAILISGSARSGTTIMGKVLHSFQSVEYTFEPPTLFSLFSLLPRLDEVEWKLLYETYLYEDFFVNAIAGRNLNLNRNDDSCVYNAKAEAEVDARYEGSLRKAEINKQSQRGVIAFKLPDIVPFLPQFLDYYPETRLLFMRRNPVDTLKSLLKKGWFSDRSLNEENRIWPFHQHADQAIPYWVAPEDYERWVQWSELDRCAYYYTRVHALPPIARSIFVLDYDQLLADPLGRVEALAQHFGLRFRPKTRTIIDSIQKTKIERDHTILGKVHYRIREKIEALV